MYSEKISLLKLLYGFRGENNTCPSTISLGRSQVRRLLAQWGSAEQVLEAGWEESSQRLFGRWTVDPRWEEDIERAEKAGVRLISYKEPEYPQRLQGIPDAPLLLYVRGQLPSTAEIPALALIGTRAASLYGREQAEKMAALLAAAEVVVVSGLARGIDTAAHQGALKARGKTWAVIGSGLGELYPRENIQLAEEIVATGGALISEFPMRTKPAKALFPQRNRIVSGVSRGTCLIESPLEGGGMITMRLAENQGRCLFALPGRVDWPHFAGNHFWLKQKRALLVETGADLLEYFGLPSIPLASSPMPGLSEEEQNFLQRLPLHEVSVEELVLLTQLPIMQLNVFLTRLVLKKAIKELPGKIYKKCG